MIVRFKVWRIIPTGDGKSQIFHPGDLAEIEDEYTLSELHRLVVHVADSREEYEKQEEQKMAQLETASLGNPPENTSRPKPAKKAKPPVSVPTAPQVLPKATE